MVEHEAPSRAPAGPLPAGASRKPILLLGASAWDEGTHIRSTHVARHRAVELREAVRLEARHRRRHMTYFSGQQYLK